MLRNSENSEYHTYFKKLFIDLGLDHYVQSAIDIEVFKAFYGQSVRQSELEKYYPKAACLCMRIVEFLWVNNYTCLRTSILKLLV